MASPNRVPPRLAVAGGIGAVEAFKNKRQVFFGDARPAVADCTLAFLAALAYLDRDAGAFRAVADGVIEQVIQHLSQPVSIAQGAGRCGAATAR